MLYTGCMNERFESMNYPDAAVLVDEIRALREDVTNNHELLTAWLDAVYEWDAAFKVKVREKYNDTKLLQEVPAWQTLVGGTVEEGSTITDEQCSFVNQEVTKFIQGFKSAHGLD